MGENGKTGKEEAYETFVEYLRENDLRLTNEREQIARAVFSRESHFEAEELLFSLRSDGKNVSRATIYRTLELLVKSGLVQKVDFGDGYSLYEASRGSPHHDHLYCLQCGRVTSFDSPEIHRLQEEITDQYDFQPEEFSQQIYGYCSECRKMLD